MMDVKTKRSYRCRSYGNISLIILLIIWLYAFYPTVESLVLTVNRAVAMGSIITVSAYLIYKKRLKLRRARYMVSMLAMGCLLSLIIGYISASIFNLPAVSATAMFLMLPALLLFCYGIEVMTILLFPVSYFLLIIPLLQPEFMYDKCLYWLAFSLCYGYIYYTGFLRRSLLAIFSILLSFAAQYCLQNWFSESDYATYYEWLFLAVTILILWTIAEWLKEPRKVFVSGISSLEFERAEREKFNQRRHWVLSTMLIAICLLFVPQYIENIQNAYLNINPNKIFTSPVQGLWEGPHKVQGDTWRPQFLNATRSFEALYYPTKAANEGYQKSTQDKNLVYFYEAYYESQQPIHTLFHAQNKFYDDKIWHSITSENKKIKLWNKKTLTVIEQVIKVDNAQRLIWCWYDLMGFTIQDPRLWNVLEAVHFVFKNTGGSAVLILSTPVVDSLEESRMRLHQFLEEVMT